MKKLNMGTAIALGVGVGTDLGVALDNIGVWIAVGTGVGVPVGTAFSGNGPKNNASDE